MSKMGQYVMQLMEKGLYPYYEQFEHINDYDPAQENQENQEDCSFLKNDDMPF